MTSKLRFNGSGFDCLPVVRPLSLTIAATIALAAAGCSADVTRFDKKNSFAFDDGPEAAASAPAQDANLYDHRVVRNAPKGPYGVGGDPSAVESEPLPEPVQVADATPQPSYQNQPYRTAAAPTAAASATPYGSYGEASPSGSSDSIEVQRGDTLYGLSRRHNVSVNDLMTENGLSSSMLRPGQVLRLPTSQNPSQRFDTATAPRAAAVASEPAASLTGASSGGASYTVKPGDSLYAIARDNGIATAELQRANNITNPRALRPGQVLVIPAARTLPRYETATPASTSRVAYKPAADTTSPARHDTATATQPAAKPAERQVAALTDTVTDATPAPSAAAAPVSATPVNAPATIVQDTGGQKLGWPVTGQIISKFGGRPDGTHNDGINLAVPLGTDVKSAEGGIVAYAGSELKGYGNLVLLRHDNGWVTAYAHNDELLVKRGDKVRRGQVIGKAGKTGTVDQPQVHFELRQGSKPVDPTPFMEKL